MARPFRATLSEWSAGAMATSTMAEKVPANASPRARNAVWLKGGFPAKRKGLSIITQAAQSGYNPILALGHFNGINWTIDDAGRWSKITGGVFAAIDAATPTPFTSGTKLPITAIARNHLFAVNGTDAKKTNGTVVTNFGFAAPAAPTTVDEGTAGNPSGTYRFALTAYNSVTGHESSLSVYSEVIVTSKKITVSWTFPTDAQITDVRVHIFKVGLSAQYFRLGSTNVTPAPNGTTGGYGSGTTSIVVNVTDTNINDLVVKSPSTTENNPPPANATFIHYHGSRMWASDGVDLWYSKISDPESFDPANVEAVNPGDDQSIMGFYSLSAELLLILKEKSAHMLTGPNDPERWQVDPLDPEVGLDSIRSLIASEGSLWWKAEQGIFRLKYREEGIGKPQRIDVPGVSDYVEALNAAHVSKTVAGYDSLRRRVLFTLPEENQTRNNFILPFNVQYNIWEDKWDPMDVSAFGTFIDPDTSEKYVAVGGYGGRVFRLWKTPYVDGVRTISGATVFTLTGKPTGITNNTLTDTGATFDTTGDGLKEVVVLAVAADGTTVQRNVISSNTATVLTLVNNWGTNPDTAWTYYIGSPNFEFDTQHMRPTAAPVEGNPFTSRAFKRVMIKALSDTGASTATVFGIVNSDLLNLEGPLTVTLQAGGARWDIDTWDVGKWGEAQITIAHRSLGVKGRTLGLRVLNRNPQEGLILLGLGVYGTELGYKV